MIYDLLEKLSKDNSRNYKIGVLNETKCPEIKEFFELVFDKIKYKYFITPNQLDLPSQIEGSNNPTMREFKEALKPLYTRELTGHKALKYIQEYINDLTPKSQRVLFCIMDRDLHCGVNLKTAESVYGPLTFKMPYMRCSLMDKVQNIKFPAILQLKADGTYRTFVKNGDSIAAYSRSGEEYNHPKIFEALKNKPNGAYIGELIANGYEGSSSEVRYASNGALNSLNPPEDVSFFVWDYLTIDELNAKYSNVPYAERFRKVEDIFRESGAINPIETYSVSDLNEAQKIAKKLISEGKEGAILKDTKTPFEDKTSKYQIKLKLEIEIDVRCVGFTKGNGRFKDTFGAIEFQTDDGCLAGQCSGIPDAVRAEIWDNAEGYIEGIFTIKGNDITKAKKSEIYGVMHPQFIGFRNDKSETDDIGRILGMVNGKF
mgnify:CR=1 FL=1